MLFDRFASRFQRPRPKFGNDTDKPSAAAIRQELEKILSSKTFVQAPRLKRFLRFVVEETVAGRGVQLKEHVIGLEVFEKDTAYDPRIDPVVRTEARRLRYKLKEYYDGEGSGDALKVDLPKGTYCPVFRNVIAVETSVPDVHQRTRTRNLWAGTAVALLVAVVGYSLWNSRTSSKGSIAVLPLENLSGDPEQEYFSDGITDALITDLAKLSALRVISRTSILQFKRTKLSATEIAHRLSVDYLVEGTVFRSANRIRITAQLISIRKERHLWAETYERDATDVLRLQNDVAQAVAGQIHLRLTPQDRQRLSLLRPVAGEAYEAYLKGKYLWNQRNPESVRKSIAYFRQAIAHEPTYALAHAGLADSYLVMEGNHWVPSAEVIPNARAAAARSIELDPTLGEPHATLGAIAQGDWNWRQADREFQECMRLAPNYATGHQWYAELLSNWGRFDEAIQEAQRALQLDPLSSVVSSVCGVVQYRARHYDEAARQFLRTRDLFPHDAQNGIPLGMTYMAQGRYPEAIAVLEEVANRTQRMAPVVGLLGYAYASSGNRRRAEQLLAELKAHPQRSPVLLVTVYLGLREREPAMEWLQKAYKQHSPFLEEIKVGPIFDDARTDPRFQEVLRKMNWPD